MVKLLTHLVGLEPWLGPASSCGIPNTGQRPRKGFSYFSALESEVLVELTGTMKRLNLKDKRGACGIFLPLGGKPSGSVGNTVEV